ncbi:Uu.00g087750.m01.CDS01 [Anthostomella pinea]|uniref:Uu.00g087750.m01.CDS01 n=1 Tax=Anthostomella pinea TaxID=933095 RepID=A0AAI8YHL9_9PEZI|nr:Uu.00g087750.m01.CDS01 [Anthostomella pinea]
MVSMRDDRSHSYLAQVPLTVSPFVTLPTAATLPYTYKRMPSTLSPPASGITGATDEKPKYVISQSGHAAHPDDIVASCRALQAHITKMQEEAARELRELDDRIRERELAEKRRVAPGWLDSEARLLEPVRKPGTEAEVAGSFAEMSLAEREGASEMAVDQGEELDRAFGGMR